MRSTDVPRAERFDWWCDLVRQDLVPTHITSSHQADFQAWAMPMELGPVRVSVLSFPNLESQRTPQLIRQSDPELWEIGYIATGTMGLEQARSRALTQAGDLLLYDTSRPFDAKVTEGGRIIVLHLPKTVVPVPAPSLRGLVSRRLPARGSGAMLTGFLQELARWEWHGWEAERLGSAAIQLASAFLGHLADTEGLLPPETRQVALLYSIKVFIEANLADPHLTPRAVADAHHISVRYLHHLFREEKQTVGTFIREQRLERCRADLIAPGFATRPVAAVCARWGFTDPAGFNRAFKAAYGMPPGEYRKQAGLNAARCDAHHSMDLCCGDGFGSGGWS